MNRSVRRAVRAISLTVLAASLVVPATISARGGTAGPAGSSPELQLSIGARCLVGSGFTTHDTVRLTQRRGTKTLTDVTFKLPGSGFSRCLAAPVAVGDLVKFVRSVGTTVKKQRTITVPDLRIVGDLGANTLTIDVIGGVPENGALGVGVYAYVAGLYSHGLGTGAPLDDAGHAVVPMDGHEWTLQAGDLAYVMLSTPSYDRIYRWWAPRTMTAEAGKAAVVGSGKPGSAWTVTLAAAGGATRGTATANVGLKGIEGMARYATTFRRNGAAVVAKPGNVIRASGMDPDGRPLRVNDLQVVAGNGDGSLTGTCHPGSRVAFQHNGGVEWEIESPSGAISRSDLFLSSGDRIVIGCQTADGYGQRFRVTVP